MIEEGLGWELMVPKGRYDLILRSDIRPDNIDPDDEHTLSNFIVYNCADIQCYTKLMVYSWCTN